VDRTEETGEEEKMKMKKKRKREKNRMALPESVRKEHSCGWEVQAGQQWATGCTLRL
jgi:hypothetical protein